MYNNSETIMNIFSKDNIVKNILNLIILLVVVCLVYQVLNYINRENYQSGITLVTDIDTQIGFSLNGYTIQDIQSQKYLTHKNDDSRVPLYFDASSVVKEKYKTLNYDITKFNFEKAGDNESYFIKSSGPIDPVVGDTYISSDSQYGLKNVKPNIPNRVEANKISNNAKFKIKSTSSPSIFLINSQQYIIKPFIPDVINTINEYVPKFSYERHNNTELNQCSNSDSNQVDASDDSTIFECANKCDKWSNCNHFQYYYRNAGDTTNIGKCVLYDKCEGDSLEQGGTNSVIYDKSDIRAKLSRDRENKFRILGVKNKNYNTVKKLIDENRDTANIIINELKNIKETGQYGSGHSQINVNNHNEILNLIDDPSRNKDIKMKISQDYQDMKICDLEQEVARLEKLSNKNSNKSNKQINSKEIKGVQSFSNSQVLNVYPGKKSENDTSNFLIFGNAGCLAFNQNKEEDGKKINQYDFVHCNVQNDQQQFNIHEIKSLEDYNNTVSSPIDKLSSNRFVDMGFKVVKPQGQDNECLTLNENGLTVEPCTLDTDQRFSLVNSVTPC